MDRQRARASGTSGPLLLRNVHRARKLAWAAGTAGPKWPEVKVFVFFIFQKQILMHILMNFDSILMQISMQIFIQRYCLFRQQ
jgi:hypothetical protein